MNHPNDSFSPFIKMVVQPSAQAPSQPLQWSMPEEGQLAVDVLETETDVFVVSTLAGADSENIEISLHNDLLTIRGSRPELYFGQDVQFFHKECFWGKFSRTIVLPVDVKGDMARAEYKNGLLIITIPKQKHNARIPVTVVDE